MNGSILNVDKYRVVILDDFYSKFEYDAILDECLFFSKRNKLLPPKDTASAESPEGEYLKNNSGIFLHQVFNNSNCSDILYYNRKITHPEIAKQLTEIDILYRSLINCNKMGTLLSYYENEGYYRSHHDNSVITAITWVYKEPKTFIGGNLFFENDKKNVVECRNNRTVFFPSFLRHEVEKIKMNEDKIGLGFGRFAISQFIFHSY